MKPLNTNIQNFCGIFYNFYNFQLLFHNFVRCVGFTELLTFRIRLSYQIFGPNIVTCQIFGPDIVTSCFLHCVSVFGTCRAFPPDKQLLFYLCINRYVWKTHCSAFMLLWNKFNNMCTLMHWNKISYQLNESKLCWASLGLVGKQSPIRSYGSNTLVLIWSDLIANESIICYGYLYQII